MAVPKVVLLQNADHLEAGHEVGLGRVCVMLCRRERTARYWRLPDPLASVNGPKTFPGCFDPPVQFSIRLPLSHNRQPVATPGVIYQASVIDPQD